MSTSQLDLLFINELIRLQNQPEALLSAFVKQGLGVDKLVRLAHMPNPSRPYSRLVMSSDSRCEVMLAHWSADHACAPHNHGRSEGWVFYLTGEFIETSYMWDAGSLAKRDSATHASPSFVQVEPNDVHSCVSPNGGISLHIYFPRIESMEVHDVENRRTFTVSDDCGAWLPEPKQCLRETEWNQQPSAIVAS